MALLLDPFKWKATKTKKERRRAQVKKGKREDRRPKNQKGGSVH